VDEGYGKGAWYGEEHVPKPKAKGKPKPRKA
jgi:hypothetical protein